MTRPTGRIAIQDLHGTDALSHLAIVSIGCLDEAIYYHEACHKSTEGGVLLGQPASPEP